MPKRTSKVMFFDPKWWHALPRFDLSSDFEVLGRCPNTSSRGAPRGRKSDLGYSEAWIFWTGGVPIAKRKFDPLTIRPSRRDPDTPVGRRPGEYFDHILISKHWQKGDIYNLWCIVEVFVFLTMQGKMLTFFVSWHHAIAGRATIRQKRNSWDHAIAERATCQK